MTIGERANAESSRLHQGKHLFGLKRSASQQVLNDDYEHIFPEDPFLEETGPNARVWRTYLAESAIFDGNMVGEARDGLDAMLVFAGLFSAVVTSFLVQTSQNLQVDYTQVSAALLYELVRAAAEGASANMTVPSSLNPNAKFVPNTLDVWVNGLWVVSLALSLVVALASVLIKQWLHRYMSLRSGTPGERSHVRHYRFGGFETWQVLTIIGSLPVIMHISLALFLAGLILFLVPLHVVLSWIIGTIAAVVYALYFATNILPIFYPQCPYQTPLSSFFLSLGECLKSLALRIRQSVSLGQGPKSFPNSHESTLGPLNDLEKSAVDRDYDTLSVQALHWLFTMSSNTSVHSVVMQAIGGLPANAKQDVNNLFNFNKVEPVLEHLLLSCTSAHKSNPLILQCNKDLENVAEKICRTLLFFPVHPHTVLASTVMGIGNWHTCQPTFLTTGYPTQWHAMAYKSMLTYHNIPHHPLVWTAMLRNALSLLEAEGIDAQNLKLDPALCNTLLRVLWDPLAPTSATTSLGMTTVMHSYPEYHLFIQNYLLHMLPTPFCHPDCRHLPLSNRVIEAAIEFALHNIGRDANHRVDYWGTIDYIFECFEKDLLKDEEFDGKAFRDFVGNLIIRLTQQNTQYWPQKGFIKMYWQTKLASGHQLLQSEIQVIRRAINLSDHREHPYVDHSLSNFSLRVEASACDNLSAMLLCHSSAESWHQIFVDDDFLGQHYKYHLDSSFILSYPIHPLNIRIVGSFISSLGKMRGGMKGHFVDYLYQPQNIRRALLILVFEQQIQSDIIGQPHNYGLEDILSDLAQLHPDRRLLTGCRDWLAFFSQWNLRVRHTGRGFRDILDMEKELFLPYGIESPPYGIPETETDLLEGMIQILDRVLNKRKDEIEQDTPTIVTAASATAPIEASESPPRAETSSAQVSTGPQSVLVQYVSRWPQLRRLLQWRTKQDGSDVELQSVV